MAGNPTLPTENINEVILRLLALEPNEVDELDYDTYKSRLREILVEVTTSKRKIDDTEFNLVKNEFKRVRGKKGRFKIKKTKITASGLGIGFNGIKKQILGTKQKLMLAPVGGVPKQTEDISKGKGSDSDVLSRISKTLDSILETLININKENKNKSEKERRDAEDKRRQSKEKELESKPFEGLKKVVSAITKPFQSIWDRVVDFITNIILGRIVLKLIDWFGDPENQKKIRSLVRFFKDHWPTLLALYLRFGTGIGRFVGKLGGILIKGAFKLTGLAAKLAVKAGIGKAGGKLSKVAGFLGGPRGKAVASGLGIAADVAVTAGTAIGVEKLFGGDEKVQGFSGGGYVKPRFPAFSGGGFNFKGLMGGASLGAMFGPLGMLLGAGVGSGMFNGLIKGPGGSKGDKIPAMLSDGEFVMSAGAVNKYGVDTLEAMNAAGGGTNTPKIANGIIRAAGGGYVGDAGAAQDAWIKYMNANPEKFAKHTGIYGTAEATSDAAKDFLKTFMKTGQPPDWAKFVQGVEDAKASAPKPPSGQPSRPRQEPYSTRRSQRTPGSSWWENFRSQQGTRTQTPPPSSPPPNTSSTSLMRRPTSALSTNVRSPGTMRPRGYGGALQAAFAAMEFADRKQQGQTNAQAGLGAAGSALGGSVGWMAGAKAGALLGGAIGAMFGGVGAAPGAAIGAIIGGVAGGFGGASLGGKLADDVSGVNAAKERLSRGGVGGAIKGGFGLKKETPKDEFKNAPKTMVMTDDKGRPFVGHKAMKGGKLTYVRPSKPGTGTTNPLEMIGRAINPSAYRDSDARLAMKNQKIAMVNALERFQSQGMSKDAQARMMKQMGGNLKDVQNDLNYRKTTQKKNAEEQKRLMSGNDKMSVMRRNNAARISSNQTRKPSVKPLPKPKPRPYTPAGGGMGGRRGSGARPTTSTRPPSFSPTHKKGTQTTQAALGVKKK
jgi:hypothetical protein